MAKKCTHNLAEKETALNDGLCPLCLAKDIIRFNDKCVKMRRELEAEIRTLKIHAKEDVFEIRIPNLRKDEIPIVRKTIREFTRGLLNSLILRRNQKDN